MIMDATKSGNIDRIKIPTKSEIGQLAKTIDNRVLDFELLGETLLVVTVKDSGRAVVKQINKI